MSRRALFALSAGLTAFVLVVAGAVATYALRPGPAPGAASSTGTSVPLDALPAATDPGIVQRAEQDDRPDRQRRRGNDEERRHEREEDDDG